MPATMWQLLHVRNRYIAQIVQLLEDTVYSDVLSGSWYEFAL